MFTLIILTFVVLYLLYKLTTTNFNHWKERNVPYVKPVPFFGNFWKVFSFQSQIGHYLAEIYNQFDTPYFGIFFFNKPHLVVKCPELIKLILVRDFSTFNDRTVVSDEKCDSLASKFMFFVRNPEWKFIRNKIAPVFTTGKLKSMLPLIDVVAKEMNDYLEKHSHQDSIEVKEVIAKYSTDVIASCAFGIEANCFKSENAEFRKVGRLIFDFRLKTSISQTFHFVAPSVIQFFRIPFFDPVVTNFMRKMFWETYNDRLKTHKKRNDLIDIIIQIKEMCKEDETFKFEGDRVVAQAGQFLAAGFETVSSTVAFALYELCLQPDIQERVRVEVKDQLSIHGELSHDALKDMSYLEMVLFETLRKYPVLPFLDRICIEDYKVPNSDLIIEKGTPVYIPMFGLHYDPKYFPNPEKFDPERFSPENKDSFPEFAFIPFGKGPRKCIGDRFGFLSSKLGLAQILSEFRVEPNSLTPVPLEYEKKGFLLASKVGLPMKFVKLDN